jgi:hypothetical protein
MKTNAKSRRYTEDRPHVYGWAVGFFQTVNGERHHYSSTASTRKNAIWNALNCSTLATVANRLP